jgi:hypothetical protein
LSFPYAKAIDRDRDALPTIPSVRLSLVLCNDVAQRAIIAMAVLSIPANRRQGAPGCLEKASGERVGEAGDLFQRCGVALEVRDVRDVVEPAQSSAGNDRGRLLVDGLDLLGGRS